MYLRIFDIDAPLKSHVTGVKQFKKKNVDVSIFLGKFFTSNIASSHKTNDDGDGKENGKYNKHQLCTCITLFCTFLCRLLHNYDMTLPNFTWQFIE